MRCRYCGAVSDGLRRVLVRIVCVYDVVFAVYFLECFDVDWRFDNAGLKNDRVSMYKKGKYTIRLLLSIPLYHSIMHHHSPIPAYSPYPFENFRDTSKPALDSFVLDCRWECRRNYYCSFRRHKLVIPKKLKRRLLAM